MKNRLKKAVEAHNLPEIRSVLIEMIRKGAGSTADLTAVTEAIESTPDLFVRDDGRKYAPSADKMTPELISELEKDIKSNFSVKKLKLLTEVCAIKARDPHFFSRLHDTSSEVADPDAVAEAPCNSCSGPQGIVVEEVIEEVEAPDNSALAQLLINEQEMPAEESVYPPTSKAASVGRKFGFALMIAGIVAAIVALSVPVRFLLGVSIGVIMLGAALVYAAINRPIATVS